MKVCSHMRSGTHWLMATLTENFDLGDDLAVEIDHPYAVWAETGAARARVPWGRLFGSHARYEEAVDGIAPAEMLYLVRDPYATLRSLAQIQPSALVTVAAARAWQQHVESYVTRGVYTVRYGDLRDHHDRTLDGIAVRFDLRRPTAYRRVMRAVGWRPKDASLVTWDPAFRALIPDGFMGYVEPRA